MRKMYATAVHSGAWILAVAAVVFSTLPALAAELAPLPTTEELKAAYDAGQYQPLLTKLTRVLNLKGDAAKPYDRVDLELLRANTALQLKQQSLAGASLEEAVKAITPQTPPKLANEVIAMRALVKRSSALAFTPKTDAGKGKPISLTDPAQRKPAMEALLADCKAEVAAKTKAAASSKSLLPIIAGINGIDELRAIEMTAAETDTASQDIAGELASQAASLMDEAMKKFTPRINRIRDDANVLVANPQQQETVTDKKGKKTKAAAKPTTYHKMGLNSNYTRELNAIVDTCQRISSACKDFTRVAPRHATNFKSISDAADQAVKDATEVLNADYKSSVTK